VAADDLMAGVVQLGGHEAVVVDLVDVQRGDDVGQHPEVTRASCRSVFAPGG
jgi:hypothetical protein